MRGPILVDPDAIDYGRATPALQVLLRRWSAIEWFEPLPDARLEDNPFEALLRCHAEGALVFSLGPAELLAFGFRG